RPAGAEVEHPRRRGAHLLDELADAADADVEREGEVEAALPGEEAPAERERRGRDRVVEEALVAARVVLAALVALAVHRDRDAVLDERTDLLLREEDLTPEIDAELVDAVDVEAVALDARDRRAALGLRVLDDLGGVVEDVGRVGAEAERDGLLGV